jgi:hypothetical protein
MTENRERRAESRLDLRALDVTDDLAREDAVILAASRRISTRAHDAEWPDWMTRAQRGLAAAAAVLLLMAGAVVLAQSDQSAPADPAELIQHWARSSHIPTNGELLSAYMGYRQ